MILNLSIRRYPLPNMTELIALRKECVYPSPVDPRYWNGGLHELLDEDTILARHDGDPTSHFAVACDGGGAILAYSRFSLCSTAEATHASEAGNAVAKLHVIVAREDVRGRELQWKSKVASRKGRIGVTVCGEIVAFCRSHGCSAIESEIVVHPIPNLPSLRLHRTLGFGASAKPLRYTTRLHESGARHEIAYTTLSLKLAVAEQ